MRLAFQTRSSARSMQLPPRCVRVRISAVLPSIVRRIRTKPLARSRRPRRTSATSSESSRRLPNRPTCWHSTPPSKPHATQTAKATGEIGAKIAEIQSTTGQAVASIGAITEAIDELSIVTNSIAAAMDQQRAATEGFVTNVRGTTAAVSDVAVRMTGIAEMVTRSSTNAVEVTRVAAEMQRASETVRAEIPEIVRTALRADLRGHARFDVNVTATIETGGHKTQARVFDLSRAGARVAAVPDILSGADVVVTLHETRPLKGKIAWVGGGCFGVRFDPALEAAELLGLINVEMAA